MFKYTIPQLLQIFMPSLEWRMKASEKTVYLTFDDGPHPQITPWVLSMLEQFKVKATFFCVGENVSKFPETFNQIIQSENAVGNHTYNHLNGWKTENEIYFNNIAKCNDTFPSKLFRPPYGKISFSQIKKLKHHYRIIMWDVLSRDYDKNLDVTVAIKKLKQNIRNGSIIVFHDSEKAEKNMKVILPEILQYLKNKGFDMKTL